MASNPKKRRIPPVVLEENPGKRIKIALGSAALTRTPHPTGKELAASPSTVLAPPSEDDVAQQVKPQKPSEPAQKRPKIIKLTAPRPFPAVALSASATGPRSAHKEGKNYICLTRKTSLGAYMRRCKNLMTNDGYQTLHLHAMGAAIPLLLQLACALPPILPFPKDEIHTEISTGTAELQDEVIPDNEDEDITYQTRGKSTLYLVIHIGDGQPEKENQNRETKKTAMKPKSQPGKVRGKRKVLVFEEPEQEQESI